MALPPQPIADGLVLISDLSDTRCRRAAFFFFFFLFSFLVVADDDPMESPSRAELPHNGGARPDKRNTIKESKRTN